MSVSERLRVCVAEDHEIVREGLRALIEAQGDLEVVGTAGDGVQALHLVRELRPDVIVMDITMPGLNGVELAAQLAHEETPARIVVLSVHEDRSYVQRLIAAGAAAYVLKRSAVSQLIHAIRTVSTGGLYIDPALAPIFAEPLGRILRTDERPAQLTGREVEVVKLVAAGLSNREIAGQLGITVKTVETHKRRINEKMRFASRADLVRYALRTGLLQADPT